MVITAAWMPDQRSLTDQLQDLVGLANRHRLYDAADFISIHVLHQGTAIPHHASTYDRRVAGHMSWKDVDYLARQNGGRMDRSHRPIAPAAQDTRWVFTDENGYGAFVSSLERKHMNFKADPELLSVMVWF
jgi:hypothetical protein